MIKLFLIFIVIIIYLSPLKIYSQSDLNSIIKNDKEFYGIHLFKKWYLNFSLFTPSTAIYFDQGKDYLNDADFFQNGSPSFNTQLISADFLHGTRSVRTGVILGCGYSKILGDNTTTDGSFAMFGKLGSLVSFFNQSARAEIGLSFGLSTAETYNRKYDYAIYFELSLPIVFSQKVTKALTLL